MYLNEKDTLWQLLCDIAKDEGLFLYDLDKKSDHSIVVMVDKQGGVTSGECSALCKRLVVFFTAQSEKYGLSSEPAIEVCSPGINRTLRLPAQFKTALGSRLKIVLSEPISIGERIFSGALFGVLKDCKEQGIVIEHEGDSFLLELSFDKIKKARVDYIF